MGWDGMGYVVSCGWSGGRAICTFVQFCACALRFTHGFLLTLFLSNLSTYWYANNKNHLDFVLGGDVWYTLNNRLSGDDHRKE